MRWFGFGFNAFGQIHVREKLTNSECRDATTEVKVAHPVELTYRTDCCVKSVSQIKVKASWSRSASLNLDGESCVCLSGYGAVFSSEFQKRSHGCRDFSISESHLTLAFPDKVESWDLQSEGETPSWSMGIKMCSGGTDLPLNLPLVPGGYVTTKPPFLQPLSPQLKAQSLALGAEHAILLTASGAVYTWGLGSHGQLGHGCLTSEEEPRVLEALWGMPMSCVSTGGWHSVSVSEGGDLYVWGWNKSGQLGLPSRGLMKTLQQHRNHQPGSQHQDGLVSPTEEPHEGQKGEDVFISIQAFPALLDITPTCQIKTVSCGSRHTAAVTTTGGLYTWGWGDYGQLGHQTLASSDEPLCVEFFREQQMRVVDVVCGPWNTFAAVIKEAVDCSQKETGNPPDKLGL